MSADIVGNGHVLGDVRPGLDRRNVVDGVAAIGKWSGERADRGTRGSHTGQRRQKCV